MGFGPLRVINEDRVAAGQGFGTHAHRDMEIISYVLDGELAHKDSLGNGSVIRPGDVQRMSAGTGVRHCEFNPSKTERGAFPADLDHAEPSRPRTQLRSRRTSRRRRSAAGCCWWPRRTARDGSVVVHQDAKLYAGLLDGAESAALALAPGRLGYVHVARGAVHVNGQALQAGDAAKLVREPTIELADGDAAEVLVFDLPPDR